VASTTEEISSTIQNQIQSLEESEEQVKEEIENQTKGFSLFGWLNRLFSK